LESGLPLRALQTGTGDYVELDSLGKGIGISARITAPDGKVIVLMENNQFVANSNNTLSRTISPDGSTLKVLDEYGNLALSVEFLNPHSIKILGLFSTPSGEAKVEDDQISRVGHRGGLSHACMSNNYIGLELQ
jgi:hypothetical protein